MSIHRLLVSMQDEGSRLGKMVSKYFTVPFSAIAKLVRTGKIRVNGKRCELNAKLETGDEVRIPKHDDRVKRVKRKKKQFSLFEKRLAKVLMKELVYKDKHIVALNKPAGLAVQGGSKVDISVDSLSRLLQFNSDIQPRLVHRLDKDTSGLLLLARTKPVAQELSRALKERTTRKRYIGILNGIPEVPQDTIESSLRKTRLPGEHAEKVHEDSEGKRAVTEYKVLDSVERKRTRLSLVEFRVLTGRTHQIRVHSAAIGCPVLGDVKYADEEPPGNNPLFLHAWKMEFPLFDKCLRLEASLPSYFTDKLSSVKMKINPT